MYAIIYGNYLHGIFATYQEAQDDLKARGARIALDVGAVGKGIIVKWEIVNE